MAQPIRNVVNDGAKASTHEPRAVIAVESSSTFLAPTMSPRRASTGTQSADTIELRSLEPVDVGVGDLEVVGDVAEDRGVVALQDAAGQLDADQEADDGDERVRTHRPLVGLLADVGRHVTFSISRWYQSIPSTKSSTPRCSS